MVILAMTESYMLLAKCTIMRDTYSGTREKAFLGKTRLTEKWWMEHTGHVIVRGASGESLPDKIEQPVQRRHAKESREGLSG